MSAESATTHPACAHCGTEIWPTDRICVSPVGTMHHNCGRIFMARLTDATKGKG